jgi:hypothetical protein
MICWMAINSSELGCIVTLHPVAAWYFLRSLLIPVYRFYALQGVKTIHKKDKVPCCRRLKRCERKSYVGHFSAQRAEK